MELTPVIGAAVFLAVLLAILGLWQRRIDRRERGRVVEEIRDSLHRGTHRAIAQHPQVNPLACIGCSSCIRACPEDGVLGLVDGIAHVIHASRCVGHARCEAACPVGAIRVGLGDISARPDIPILDEALQTTVPGIHIAGELGGIALIRHAVDQGARSIDAIAQKLGTVTEFLRNSVTVPSFWDVLIVGAGPAGLSAALRARQLGLRAVSIDQDEVGGTIRKYPRRKMTLVQPVEIPLHGKLRGGEYAKEELIDLWEAVIRRHGVEVRRPVKLNGLERKGELLVADTTAGPIAARAVVLALGRRGTPRKLGVPGEESEKVFYQLIDAAGYAGQRLLVVGGGDSAVEAALALAAQPGNEVVLSYRKECFFRLKPRNEERIGQALEKGAVRALFSSEVERIEPSSVALRAKGPGDAARCVEVPNDHVFVFAGGEMPFDLLRKIGVGFGGEKVPEKAGA